MRGKNNVYSIFNSGYTIHHIGIPNCQAMGEIRKMSYGSEYLDETAYEREQVETWYEIAEGMAIGMASQGLWETKEGKILSVKEMTTSHIKNCINMLNRNNSPFADIYVPMFERELAERKKRMEVDDYIQGDPDHNVQVALKRLKEVSWKNNPTIEDKKKFAKAQEIIISILAFGGYDIVRKEE